MATFTEGIVAAVLRPRHGYTAKFVSTVRRALITAPYVVTKLKSCP